MHCFMGKTALVTGASSGIGYEAATYLAEAGANLILVARITDRLTALKETLQEKHDVQVDVISRDLLDMANVHETIGQVEALGVNVDILVNNAGYGYEGPFLDQDVERLRNMMQLNMDTLTYLTHYYGRKMRAASGGYILLTSSVGGFVPCPGMAVYDATKAYVLLLGEALSHELKPHGVVVTTLCPGATRTEFFKVSGQTLNFLVKATLMNPADTARLGLWGLSKGKVHVVPNLLNKLTVWSLRLAPRAIMAPIAGVVMK